MTGPNGIPASDGTVSRSGADGWAVTGYTPFRELGSGASGRVVLATHDETGSPVAIKYLSERLRGDSTFLAGFRAEAKLLGTLRSPYVVELYEYVESLRGAAIVMEPVDGIPLRALLRQEGATEPEAALTVLKGSLLGLAAAHAAGVVHRDYKPANVLIAADGTSKLVDFGIAVPSGAAGNAAGTPVYMAPEQWTGQPASPATDVYAATATFFECLTGAKPYTGETVMELAIQHMEAPIPDALAPEQVRPLIRSGLAKTPEERPASAADFITELEAVATAAYGEDWEERGRRKLAALAALLLLLLPSAHPDASGTTALATTTLGPGPHSRRLSRRGKVLAGMAAATVLVGGLTVTAVAIGNHSVSRSAAAGSPTTGSSSDSASPTTAASAEHTKAGTPSGSVSAKKKPSSTPKAQTDTDTTSGADGSSGGSSSGGGGTSGSISAGDGASDGSSSGSSSGGTTTSGSTSSSSGGTSGGGTTAPTTTAAPKLDVISVTIDASGPLSSGCSMVASVTVQTNGAADGTLTLSWFTSSSATAVGTVVATDPVSLPKGQTQVSGRYAHTFTTPERSPYLGVEVSTSPAADSGNGSFVTVSAPAGCNPVR